MIRVFDAFGKSFFHCNPDLIIFDTFMNNLQVDKLTCPLCGAKYNCSAFSSYSRHMITFENGLNTCHNISIDRVICHSCNHTHAILPDILIPFGSYTLSFVLTALRAYFLSSKTVTSLCEYFQISVSTLYTWIKLFIEQKHIWLGLLNDASTSPSNFIDDLLNHRISLSAFHNLTNISFLQHFKTTPYNSS
jgi:transposase-like protein